VSGENIYNDINKHITLFLRNDINAGSLISFLESIIDKVSEKDILGDIENIILDFEYKFIDSNYRLNTIDLSIKLKNKLNSM